MKALFYLSDKIKNKFLKTFKNKRSLFVIVLAVIAIGLFLPRGDAHAIGLGDWIASGVLELLSPILYIIFWVLFLIAYFIAYFAAGVMSLMLNPAIINDVLNMDSARPLYQAWTIFRDVANLLFILILLLIALGTIFRAESYNIKKSLYKFILIIFLINFSGMIAGLFIDFGNFLMYGVLKIMCTSSGSNTCFVDFFHSLMEVIDKLWNKYTLDKMFGGFKGAAGMAIAMIYTFIYALILLALGIFLLIRIAALAILIIISPLAFFGYTAPGLAGLKSKWWDNLVQYVMFGPVFALMLYISGLMMKNTIAVDLAVFNANQNLSGLSGDFAMIITYSIPLIFLVAIIPVTKAMGIAGANAILGATVGTGIGATKWLGGVASDSWGRYVARGAGHEGKGFYGKFRRGLSNFSPTAWKQAYKAKQARDTGDYDVATGRQRNKMEDPFGVGKKYEAWQHRNDPSYRSSRPDYEQKAKDERANKDWKDKGITTKDEAVAAIEQGKKNGTMGEEELKIAVKFIAAEGGIDDTLERSSDASGVAYGAGPEELMKYVNDTFGHLGKEEKSKLLTSIAKAEDKNGNTTYNGLGVSGYNATTKRVEYEINDLAAGGDYIDPTIDPKLPPAARTKTNPATGNPYTKKEWQEEQQVKAANKKLPKDLKKSSFLNKSNDITEAGEQIMAGMKGDRAKQMRLMDRDRAIEIDKALKKKYTSVAFCTGANPDLGNAWSELKTIHGL